MYVCGIIDGEVDGRSLVAMLPPTAAGRWEALGVPNADRRYLSRAVRGRVGYGDARHDTPTGSARPRRHHLLGSWQSLLIPAT